MDPIGPDSGGQEGLPGQILQHLAQRRFEKVAHGLFLGNDAFVVFRVQHELAGFERTDQDVDELREIVFAVQMPQRLPVDLIERDHFPAKVGGLVASRCLQARPGGGCRLLADFGGVGDRRYPPFHDACPDSGQQVSGEGIGRTGFLGWKSLLRCHGTTLSQQGGESHGGGPLPAQDAQGKLRQR